MCRGGALLLASLLLAGTLSTTLGLGSPVEKRGWTLNSAGYLLGPHAVDSHRSLQDKHGLAGRRELQPQGGAGSGLDKPLPEKDIVRTIIEVLTFLRLKEAGALEPTLSPGMSSEDTERF